ncbi:hypothetical protein ACIGDI_39045 [Streptomyces sp. NPDC085900]|uniref:hypothetical protein n=1 Tax=Streptomyces sp. NPDC085900 TaxID=3365737 RepID=UPI0037CF57F9
MEWPAGKEPLVMTVDCASLPRDVLDIQLPDEGSLLFFTHIAYPPESSAVVHVPADAETEERPAVHEIDGESWPIEVHEQRTLYPVVGSTVDDDWTDEGAALAFVEAHDDGEGRLDRFVKAVLDSAHGGTPFTASSNSADTPARGRWRPTRRTSFSSPRYRATPSTTAIPSSI